MKDRRYADDLPFINISRLRAEGAITPETSDYCVRLGDLEQTVGVKHRKFPCGGGWSSFVSPCCGVQVRLLRLLNSRLLCSRCLRARGVLYHSDSMGVRQRALRRIPQLLERLNTDKPLRFRPLPYLKMERRARHEEALQRNLLVLKRHDLAALERAMKAKE